MSSVRSAAARDARSASRRCIQRAVVETLEQRRLLTVARPDHIVVIIEEDRMALAIGDTTHMPYTNQIAAGGLVYNNAHAPTHPSRPNYYMLISGSTQGVTDNDTINPQFTGPNLMQSLNNNPGTSFIGYAESLPSDGSTIQQAQDPTYDPDHHPDIYYRPYVPQSWFANVGTGKTLADVHKTFSEFPTSANYASLPTVSFVIPDMLHNTHGSNEAPYTDASSDYVTLRHNADTWLQTNFAAYIAWAKTNNSLLIITEDEDDASHSPAKGITTIVIGDPSLVQPGTNNTNVGHYNTLRTIEDMYGLPLLGGSSTAADWPTDANGRLIASTVAQQNPSSTALVANNNPSVFGQSVKFTATVTSSAGGTPTGSVTFKDGATTIGTGTLNASGVATFTTTTLSVATHTITAVYGGDTNYLTSTSSNLSQVVNKANTTTTISATTAKVFGQSVTFTATVAAVSPGTGTPTGTVQFTIDGVNFGSPVTLSSGQATSSATTTLSVGSHQISAVYAASTSYNTSTATNVAQQVNAASTTTTISPTSATVFGQSVTFTATVAAVSPGSGMPPGTVQFLLDGVNFGSPVTLNASAQATSAATTTLSVGSHTVSAVYAATTNYNTSTATNVAQQVNPASTTTTISATTAKVFGQSVTFTATVAVVSPGTGTPTGTVQFTIDGVNFGSPVALSGGQATSGATTTLSVGSHNISAVYAASTNYSTSTATSVAQQVNPASTTTTISATSATVFGQSVTFTATVAAVSPGTGTPTGTVQFTIDGVNFGSPVTLSAGQATSAATTTLSVGSHNISAVYAASTNYSSSTATNVAQLVNPASTTTTVSATSATVFGQSVTFTATVAAVAPGSGTPTGTVQFTIDGVNFGSPVTLSAGQATSGATTTLSVGSHNISAVYAATTNYSTSTATNVAQQVNPANTTTTISPTSATVFGQSVTFTATVAAVAPGSGTPTGTVQFTIDGVNFGSPVTLSGGQATSGATTTLSVGSHNISAVYAASTNYNTSTATNVAQQVNKAATTTALISSTNPSTSGQSITFTATLAVSPPGSGIPAGTIQFVIDNVNFGSPVALNASGQATSAAISTLSDGPHSVSAVYIGNASYSTSTSSTLTQIVNPLATNTALGTSITPSVFGQSVTFTATVTATGVTPSTGSVNFIDTDTSTTLATIALNAQGIATYATSAMSVGTHHMQASYTGASGLAASTSSTITQTVNTAATSTALVPSKNPATSGDPITFTATVTASSPGSGIPAGTVQFVVDNVNFGSPVALVNGSATSAATSSLADGQHSIQAVYNGNTSYSTSTSSTLTQNVNPLATSTALASSASPAVFGQSVTFTATVTATGVTPTSGTVDFIDIDSSTTLATVALDSQGKATWTSAMPVGSHHIQASYSGASGLAASSSSTLTQTVNAADTTTAIASSANPATSGGPVTFTATVSVNAPGAGIPGGTVQFTIDGTNFGSPVALNASGQATSASTSTLADGQHSIQAVYSGDTNDTTSTSSTLTQNINPVATSTTLASSATPAVFGQPVTFTATVDASGGVTPTTGSVDFIDIDSSTTLATVALDAQGKASWPSHMTPGTHHIMASYTGAPGLAASASSSFTESINPADTTTAIASSANPTPAGTAVSFTATVSVTAPGAGSPAGTIQFVIDNVNVGNPVALVNGLATSASISSLGAGGHSVVAIYSGDGSFNGSSSSALTQNITVATTTTLDSSAKPAVFGQGITLTATVAGSTTPNAGTVTFTDGQTTLGTADVNASGVATLTLSSGLSVGAHSITASYGGSGPFLASSTASPLAQQVNAAGTTSSITTSASPSAAGQSITFTATVSVAAPGAGTPTGTIQFVIDNVNFGAPVALDADGHAISPATTTLAVGGHTVLAVYSGDGNFTGSTSSALTQVVATPPANDNFASRTSLIGGSITASGNNLLATSEASEPAHAAGNPAAKSVWWTWTAPSSGSVTIDTAGSNFDTVLAAYTGTSLASLSSVASNDNDGALQTSKITFTAVANRTYQIAVDGVGGACGNLSLHLVLASPPLAPRNVQASGGWYTDHVDVTWLASVGATSYDVYRAPADDVSQATLFAADVTGTKVTDTTTVQEQKYWYWIVAKNTFGPSPYSAEASGYSTATPTPPTNGTGPLTLGGFINTGGTQPASSGTTTTTVTTTKTTPPATSTTTTTTPPARTPNLTPTIPATPTMTTTTVVATKPSAASQLLQVIQTVVPIRR